MTEKDKIDETGAKGVAEVQLDVIAEHLAEVDNHIFRSCEIIDGELEVRVDAADLISALTTLRDDRHAAFTQLIDLTAVDYPERHKRFDVVYLLLSMVNNMRLRLVVSVGEGQTVPSATGVFMSANWAEREVWDMFGVFFAGHPDLRRLLTDYGFEGHPLRKDFPLTGHVEVRYDDTQRRVVNEPVHLTQEFRDFDFLSPWEGMHHEIDVAGLESNRDKRVK